MMAQDLQKVLSENPSIIMRGAVCFAATRVPVQALPDTTQHGAAVDDFLTGVQDLTRQQAQAVLQWEQTKARKTFTVERLNRG